MAQFVLHGKGRHEIGAPIPFQPGRSSMKTRSGIMLAAASIAAGATAVLCLAGTAAAQQKEVMVGGMCDRTGPVKLVKDKLGGRLKDKKIAYIFYDNPAGREPIPVIEDLQKIEGFELRTFAVPPPGVEMGAQMLDITQRFRPDFVISHLFGSAPGLSIKAFKANGFPLSKVLVLVLE